MTKVLVIDNYDSFTYNLVQMVREISGEEPAVRRNDRLSIADAEGYQKLLFSPGPGIPSEAGLMPELVRRFAAAKSILGVCLGHQCIGEVFGGKLRNLARPVHGYATPIDICDKGEMLFSGLPSSFKVGRYHSWVVEEQGLPGDLVVTARDSEGYVMALRHRELDVRGVQFHPESVLTEHGREMLVNWLEGGK